VYVSAEYKEGEEIRVIVYEDGQRVLLDRQFYMTTGFGFVGVKGKSYTVRFLSAGSVTKLVSMLNSSPMQVSDDLATKEHIDGAQGKVEKIGNELKVSVG
jgi:ribosomal protein L21E